MPILYKGAVTCDERLLKGRPSKEALERSGLSISKTIYYHCYRTRYKPISINFITGADANSDSYLKQRRIQSLKFKFRKVDGTSFQPSLLLGDRQEFRFGEQAGAIVMKAFSFLLLEV
jgi:hypothetical protein